MPETDIARRAFLRGTLLTRAGREQIERRTRTWGPSPPWLASAIEAGACIGCTRPCADACTARIIRFYPADHVNADFPYLGFEEAGCSFCGDCADACTAEPPRPPARPVLGRARLDTERCLAWTRVICVSCGDRCPARAIHFDARMRPSVRAMRCNGCGSCVATCPPGALSVSALARG